MTDEELTDWHDWRFRADAKIAALEAQVASLILALEGLGRVVKRHESDVSGVRRIGPGLRSADCE